MLNPITNWSDLQRALKRTGQAIYHCDQCKRVWIASAKLPPVRCERRSCRTYASGITQDAPGRPSVQQ